MWYVYTVVLLLLLPCYVEKHKLAFSRTARGQLAAWPQQELPNQLESTGRALGRQWCQPGQISPRAPTPSLTAATSGLDALLLCGGLGNSSW